MCMPAALVCKSACTWSHAVLQDDSCAPGTAGTAGDPHLGGVAHCGEAVHVGAHRSVVDGRVCGDALQALHRRQAVHLDVCGVFKFKWLYWAKYTTCRQRLDNTAGGRHIKCAMLGSSTHDLLQTSIQSHLDGAIIVAAKYLRLACSITAEEASPPDV